MSEVCPIGPASTARLPYGLLTTLRSIVARWSERRRSRRELARLATADPHLIDDIGLTRRQLEAEIAKPLWRP